MYRGINVGKTDAAVQNHLRGQGFTGYIRVESWTDDDGRAYTVIRRSLQAVPWTSHLLEWLLQAASTLPGVGGRITPRSQGQAIEVIWDGVR